MQSRRYVSILSLIVLSATLVFGFQNCGPAKPASAAAHASSDARLIDDFNKSEIQFVAPEVQLRDEVPAADITGLCNRTHNGSVLKWTLWATTGEVLSTGGARCGAGGFLLHMAGLEEMTCGVNFQLVVEGDWGGSAVTSFVRRCQPLAREILQAADGSPYGTECSLEYVPANDGKPPCTEACYRGGLLVSQVSVDAGRCSNIAARLAGP